MTHYLSLYKAAEKPINPHLPTIVVVCSSVPVEQLDHTSVPSIDIARWNESGFEFHGDVTKNHRGINSAPFLFRWDCAGEGNVPKESRYFPFSALPDRQSEFVAISEVRSNPHLDRLQFLQAGREVTLQRLYAYHPREPQRVRYPRIDTEILEVLSRSVVNRSVLGLFLGSSA